ncbi:unnamed protein product [Bursaphelenchus xylophilus]|uniref:(pine wood nematode) hypothetical protein n=1 Tax=Bursaphelenchus xylophilus TaxID=6326 RepID=A0A1I7RSZ7_BURXY|nr:unnamed protein product [Bursaphelenchus xylophilus]CAG9122712.1 unnamed protein product [Bursaphelenchus xylophilus]
MFGYQLLLCCFLLLMKTSDGRYCGEKLMGKLSSLCTNNLDCTYVEVDLRQPTTFLRWCCSQTKCSDEDLKKYCCGLVLRAKLSGNNA